MAYYGPGDRVGGFPMGEGGPSELGGLDRGFRPGGGYIPQGYGVPSYEFERERPLGGAYVGGPPEFFGDERPGGYGYEREGYGREGFGREGLMRDGLMREGYAPSVYDQGYPRQPPVGYAEAQPSDLGMGLRDTGRVPRHHPADYGAGLGRPEVAGYGGAPGYGGGMYEDDEVRGLKKELENERRQKHELEIAAAGAAGFGLHERHEKKEAEEDDEEPKKEKKWRHFFSRD